MMRQTAPANINLPGREAFDGENLISPREEPIQSSASDSEYQHALEVIFDVQNSHRRKASLVAAETPRNLDLRRQNTECYVHALLENQRKHGAGSSGGIAGIETNVKPQIDGRVDGQGGQEDEISWQQRQAAQGQPLDGSINDGKKLDWIPEVEHAVHSRLLTKKQLSDMAWGVRELSKRLGSVRLKLKVKTVFLLTKAHDETLIYNTREVVKWLLSPERDVHYTVYVEDNLKDNKNFNAKGLVEDLVKTYQDQKADNGEKKVDRRLRFWTNEMCRARPHTFDFVVTLGGDGTVLYASWLFQRIVPPVLSFALGSLGFLTKFDYDEYQETLTKAFREGVTISLRLRFEGTVMRSQEKKKRLAGNGGSEGDESPNTNESRDLIEELVGEEKEDEMTHRPDGTYEILNDIVVDRGPNPTMSSTEIFGDDEHFTSVQADGICVSTPTGSTAYNLAAGGSLCHPENPVILVTAICAHTLSFRPIILPDTIVLRIGVPYDARASSWASFDGRERVELRPGDYVTISASRFPFANVMPQGRRSQDWVNSISGKLGWNTRQRQKRYKEWSS